MDLHSMETELSPNYESSQEDVIMLDDDKIDYVFNAASANYSTLSYANLQKINEKVLELFQKATRKCDKHEGWESNLQEVEMMMEDVLAHEDKDSPFLPRYQAIKAHCIVKRANALIETNRYEEGRMILFEAEEIIEYHMDHQDVGFVYIELLLNLGKAFLSDGVSAHAMSYYKKAEATYKRFQAQRKTVTIFPDLIGWKLDKKEQAKWNLEFLYQLTRIGIFTCAVAKKDDNMILEYSIPYFIAKTELADEKDQSCSNAKVIENILDLVDMFVGSGFLRQADHLLAVAHYNLLKERKYAKYEMRKKLDVLYYKIALKYVCLGSQIIRKSIQLIDIKNKEAFGVKASNEELLKVQTYYKCHILHKFIGEDFQTYEGIFPFKYASNPLETLQITESIRMWIKRGINISDEIRLSRTIFICYMEDLCSFEKKLRPMIKAYLSQNVCVNTVIETVTLD